MLTSTLCLNFPNNGPYSINGNILQAISYLMKKNKNPLNYLCIIANILDPVTGIYLRGTKPARFYSHGDIITTYSNTSTKLLLYNKMTYCKMAN